MKWNRWMEKPWRISYLFVVLNLAIVGFDVSQGGDPVYFALFNAACAGWILRDALSLKHDKKYRMGLDSLIQNLEVANQHLATADQHVDQLQAENQALNVRITELQVQPVEGPKVCPGCHKRRAIPVDDYLCAVCRKVATW